MKGDLKMKVCVLGCGAYGIALAMMLVRNNHDITMWTKFEDEKNMLETKRENNLKRGNCLVFLLLLKNKYDFD